MVTKVPIALLMAGIRSHNSEIVSVVTQRMPPNSGFGFVRCIRR